MEAVRTFMRVKRGMQCDTGFQQFFFLILNDFFLFFAIGHVVGERIYKSKNKCAEIYNCMCILLHKLF